MASSESTGQAPPRAVHHELRTAENSTGYLLGALKAMHTANPHLKLLDVGAGSGSISATLARAIQPDGHVTATDRDPTILPRAQVLAERTGAAVAGNMTFRQADVFALPFADASFDVTHCHQVLTHLPRPADALREMLRVTRPGGLVAAREGDLETECVWPELPALLKFHDLCARSMTLAGGTAKAGRQLLSWALEAGVPRDHITPSLGTWYYHDPTERKVWAQGMVNQLQHGRLRSVGLSAQFATEEEMDEMAAAWMKWSECEDGVLGMMQGEILIRKE